MKFNIFLSIILLSVITLFTGCDSKNTKEDELISKQSLDKKYTFFLKSTNDDDITMVASKQKISFKEKKIKNKSVLIVFWATWCNPCKVEIPHLINLKNKYKDKLEIIGVLIEQKDKKTLDEFIAKHNINYPVMVGGDNFNLSSYFGVRSIPYALLYNKNGKLVTDYTGPVLEEMMEHDIVKSLNVN
jgi:thiol-disulfide isomerase/thioredoxin